uniref:RRM domain-containing protein n=1 Tax=Ditylenchus dipsaci TaxID=166011 RepID=A0A915CNV4_9BILA
MDSVVPMPLLQQYGKVFVGPGAKKEAEVIGLGLSELSSRQRDDLERAKKYALEQSIKHVRTKQQIAHQQNQQKVAMYAQALSLMARVYVGSVSFEVREEQIKQHFAVFGPIKTINMSFDTGTGHHKGFAFLEYEVPEAALLAQEAMNGKFVGGRNLKVLPVGRPANMPQAQPIIDMVMQDAKEYNRVYVASVHPDVSEQDLKSIFEAFGEVVRCQLAKELGKRVRLSGVQNEVARFFALDVVLLLQMRSIGQFLQRHSLRPQQQLSLLLQRRFSRKKELNYKIGFSLSLSQCV